MGQANKAPEKIYVHEASAPELTEKLPYHVEYTRTDAFIEKALVWLELNLSDKSKESIKFWLEDFRNYMKGE